MDEIIYSYVPVRSMGNQHSDTFFTQYYPEEVSDSHNRLYLQVGEDRTASSHYRADHYEVPILEYCMLVWYPSIVNIGQ